MSELYLIPNYAMVTAANPAVVATGTAIKTMLSGALALMARQRQRVSIAGSVRRARSRRQSQSTSQLASRTSTHWLPLLLTTIHSRLGRQATKQDSRRPPKEQ